MATHAKRRRNMTEENANSTKKRAHSFNNPMEVSDVIHQTLPFLPTRSAVRMSSLSKQWQAVWFSLSLLDFDEGDYSDQKVAILQHENFVNMLEGYLRNAKNKEILEKFRLRMTKFSIDRDSAVLCKCLTFAVGSRSLKELNISLRCALSLETLVHAKSLTSLSLEFVTINTDDNSVTLIPSLKNLSLKNIVHRVKNLLP